jgi:hypothetical protein
MSERFERDEWDAAFRSFLASPEKWDWLVPWARTSRCLPIYCDWTHVLGINAEGAVVSHQHDDWPAEAPEVDHVVSDLRVVNTALHQGRRRHAWLAALLPPRPRDAKTCSAGCSGTGTLPPPLTPFICYCGGAGWLPATDTWVNRDRLQDEK